MNKRKCFICNISAGKTYLLKQIKVVMAGNFNLGFRVCQKCGLIIQSPCISRFKMNYYYKKIVDYTYSGNMGMPDKIKIDEVKKQKKLVSKFIKKDSKILQIGSSDGYTLSEFKTKNNHTTGIEPSISSCKFAKKNYNIDTIIRGTFENSYKKIKIYDLIILTHVLEHIYNPCKMLKILNTKLDKNGFILLEVPYLTSQKYLPFGYFTFEHLNYFDEHSIKKLILKSGYELVGKIYIDLNHKLYPIQRMLIKKSSKILVTSKKQNNIGIAKKNSGIIKSFEKKEKKIFNKMLKKINKITNNKKFSVWGAGIHSSFLLFYNPKLIYKINFFVDSDKKKWNKNFFGKKILPPKFFLKKNKEEFLVTSTISEQQINKFLLKKKYNKTIINLYN